MMTSMRSTAASGHDQRCSHGHAPSSQQQQHQQQQQPKQYHVEAHFVDHQSYVYSANSAHGGQAGRGTTQMDGMVKQSRDGTSTMGDDSMSCSPNGTAGDETTSKGDGRRSDSNASKARGNGADNKEDVPIPRNASLLEQQPQQNNMRKSAVTDGESGNPRNRSNQSDVSASTSTSTSASTTISSNASYPAEMQAMGKHGTTVVSDDAPRDAEANRSVSGMPETQCIARPLFVPEDCLYGRELETEVLQEAILNFATSRRHANDEDDHLEQQPYFVLVSGGSGTGKTKLVQSMRSFVTGPASSVNGYYCFCKFDQMKMGYSTCPMMQALSSYVSQVIEEGETAVQRVRNSIIEAFGKDAIIYINKMIPAMEDILGQPDLPSSGPDQALADAIAMDVMVNSDTATATIPQQHVSQANLAAGSDGTGNTGNLSMSPTFLKLFRAVCSASKPMVLVLDDLQWACDVFLGEIESLIMDASNEGLLLMGTCRDDVSTESPISKMMRRLEKKKVQLCSIGVGQLSDAIVHDIVQDVFQLPPIPRASLANFITMHSQGYPLFIVEIIRWMWEDTSYIMYDKGSNEWFVEGDSTKHNSCSPSSMIERRVRLLRHDLQKVLMVTACLGTRGHKNAIELALQEEVEGSLNVLVKKGILDMDDGDSNHPARYYFRHDRMQAASYGLIPSEVRSAYHLEIGLRLLRAFSDQELDKYLLVVLGQIKKGVSLITDETRRRDIAALCIRAAEKATQSSSIHAASEHLQLAFELLGDNPWHEQSYHLSLILHKYAAEVEFTIQDSPRVDELLNQILDNAKSFDDKVGAYITKIHALSTRKHTNLAIETAIDVLTKLGVNLRGSSCNSGGQSRNFKWSFAKIKRKLRTRSEQSIMRIPWMTDPKKLAAMQILNLLFLTTWMNRPQMFGFVVLKMVKLSLNDGLCAISSVAFAGYATLLCYAWDIKEGVRYGKLSLGLLDMFKTRAYMARCYGFVYGMIFSYTRPWDDVLGPLLTGQRVGLQTGDIQFANFNGCIHTLFILDAGKATIDVVLEKMSELSALNDLHGNFQELGLHCTMEVLRRLQDPAGELLDHSGLLDDTLEHAIANNSIYCLRVLSVGKACLAIHAGDHKRALEEADKLAPWTERKDGIIHDDYGYSIEAIAAFSLARRTKGAERKDHLKRGRNRMKVLQKLAKSNPYHCLAKAVLLEAEDLSIRKRYKQAADKYMHAIALAERMECISEVGWTNHCTGWHYITDLKNRTIGKDHLRRAARAYEAYGAAAAARTVYKQI
eukprot:CAMPEP_0119561134 /NCGR_PEP_ID=MMETSP1352-20130426/16777_1 /TAXON_ID=265584 /ORGANISM="Stauroneis constricta, Strain CCMP1120" /LENGTH=1271 /DNA_ID=CAMNT_0007609265 /DNA_START=130 /DNA_END=3942 /DNA_ORIENTATION=-